MENFRIPKGVMLWKSEDIRLRERPLKRWSDDVEDDIKIIET